MRAPVRYLSRVDQLDRLPAELRARLTEVEKRYVFRATDYYLSLIDWDDPDDPIRQLIVPRVEELEDWGELDASNEAAITVARGVQHKYTDTVLLLCNEVCGAYCRYCFRKRLFMDDNNEATLDVSQGLEYIRTHREVTDVLLTGGDPLLMSPAKLLSILEALRSIDHVRIIRLGSKMPAFNPWVILDQPELVERLAALSLPDRRIYLMAHFDHPRELTAPVRVAMDQLLKAGVVAVNQCPIIRGVNDDAEVLAELFRELANMGVPPYYLFQGRPTAGNAPYETPLVRAWQLFDDARQTVSGLAARARLCMSHETGKVEVLGVDEDRIYTRYHRAKDPADLGRMMLFHRDDTACWLDELVPAGTPGTRPPPRRRAEEQYALS